MARFDMSGLDPIIDEMREMGLEVGEVADSMLMAGADEVAEAWRRAAQTHGLIDTGDMFNSIGYPNTAKTFGEYRTIDIYPQGRDQKGVRNAEKAFVLHYGTSKLKATYWVDTADSYCTETVVPAMEKVWDEFIQTGNIRGADAARFQGANAGQTERDTKTPKRDYRRRRRRR